MNKWTELKTLQDVAAAAARGDEITYQVRTGSDVRIQWNGTHWDNDWLFSSRPKKKTKTIVLREALKMSPIGCHYVQWVDNAVETYDSFVCWLDTPPREVEVEE